jgi:hypothetical protein
MSDIAEPQVGPEAAEQPASQRRTRRLMEGRKNEPVTTLVGYLSGRTSAAGFLKNLREAGIWSFALSDREEAAWPTSRARSRGFTKTASLLAQSMKAKDERHVFSCLRYRSSGTAGSAGRLPRAGLGRRWDELSPAQRAVSVADAVSSYFSDSKRGREAQNVLATSLLLLSQESLDSEVALRATARALGPRAENSSRWNRERVRYVRWSGSSCPSFASFSRQCCVDRAR